MVTRSVDVLFDDIEKQYFETQAGTLTNYAGWIQLKTIARYLEDSLVRNIMTEINPPLVFMDKKSGAIALKKLEDLQAEVESQKVSRDMWKAATIISMAASLGLFIAGLLK